ncbi:MAG: hypothetical protein L6V80_05340 [Bacteroidales bacterium]|nr:MAG: hypothetical protein L6V80_05340 [Bacteroidales bacterium]
MYKYNNKGVICKKYRHVGRPFTLSRRLARQYFPLRRNGIAFVGQTEKPTILFLSSVPHAAADYTPTAETFLNMYRVSPP